MNVLRQVALLLKQGLVLAAMVGFTGGVGSAVAQEAPPDPAADQGDYQAVMRGPVHEAFAKNIDIDPTESAVVTSGPPEPIEEVPPEEAPQGDNVVWIPGYWGWDPGENQFIWVSGLWRDVPPGQRWVPGYWTEVDGGYQWVPGFWTTIDTTEVTYLDYPPQSLEEGPNVEAPSGDHFWVPGVWIWTDTDYQWQPGYWAQAYPDWVWVPAHYVWTPFGAVFVDGYWDYQLTNRGLLFAPVYFPTPIYTQPSFVFTPTVVVDTPGLLVHLFVAPHHHHYYFGDYYAYSGDFGLVPWYTFDARATYYDPLLTYYQWSYGRRGIDFVDRLRSWNTYFVQNPDFRPRRTWREQREFLRRHRDRSEFRAAAFDLAHQLGERRGDDDDWGRRLRRLDERQRNQWRQAARSFREIQTQRGDTERRRGDRDTAERERGRRGRLELPQVAEQAREVERRRGFRPGAEGSRFGDQAEPGEPRRGAAPDETPETAAPGEQPPGDETPERGRRRDRGRSPDREATPDRDATPDRTPDRGTPDRDATPDRPSRGLQPEGDQPEGARQPFRRPPAAPRDVLGGERDLKGRPRVPDSVRQTTPETQSPSDRRQAPSARDDGRDRPRGPQATPEQRGRGRSPQQEAPQRGRSTPQATPDPEGPQRPGTAPGDTARPQDRGRGRGAERTLRYPRFRAQQQTPGQPGAGARGDGRQPGAPAGRGIGRDPFDQGPPGVQPQGGRGVQPQGKGAQPQRKAAQPQGKRGRGGAPDRTPGASPGQRGPSAAPERPERSGREKGSGQPKTSNERERGKRG